MLETLTGHFHCHITLAGGAGQLRGWKKTDILLRGRQEQKDCMLTRHFVTEKRGLSNAQEILKECVDAAAALGSSGATVLRIKLEKEGVSSDVPLSDHNYGELHMKIRCRSYDGIWMPEGAALSENPLETGAGFKTYFINHRKRSGSMEEIWDLAEYWKSKVPVTYGFSVLETKIEVAVYDNNPTLDSWWA